MEERVTKEKTVPNPTVGAAGEQSLCNKHNEIIADLEAISMTELYEKSVSAETSGRGWILKLWHLPVCGCT